MNKFMTNKREVDGLKISLNGNLEGTVGALP